MEKKKLCLQNLPMVVCGDFNSRPNDSATHLLCNKKFLLTESCGRLREDSGWQTYNGETQNKDISLFNKIEKRVAKNSESQRQVRGQLHSTYSFYNQLKGRRTSPSTDEASLLRWAVDNVAKHAPYTNYR